MTHIIRIDSDLCTGCQMCADACFVDVIRWDEANDIPFAAYPDDCQICCICETVCPADAVEVIPDWKSKYYPKVLAKEKG